MLASAPNSRPSLLPLPAALLTAELGPVVMADDPCEAAFAGADPTGPRNYYRARYYDSKIGRFLSEDPIAFEGGINFYSYVENNPVNHTDPYGLLKWPPPIVPPPVITTAGAATAGIAAGVGVVVITLLHEYEEAQALELINQEAAAANSNVQCGGKKKPGCQCVCFRPGMMGPPMGRVSSPAACSAICSSNGWSGSSCK